MIAICSWIRLQSLTISCQRSLKRHSNSRAWSNKHSWASVRQCRIPHAVARRFEFVIFMTCPSCCINLRKKVCRWGSYNDKFAAALQSPILILVTFRNYMYILKCHSNNIYIYFSWILSDFLPHLDGLGEIFQFVLPYPWGSGKGGNGLWGQFQESVVLGIINIWYLCLRKIIS